MSYLELAPSLADAVADVEEGIARNRYADSPLDEYLVLALHRDMAAALIPSIGLFDSFSGASCSGLIEAHRRRLPLLRGAVFPEPPFRTEC